MAERNDYSDPNGLTASFRRLLREVEALRRALERAEERADSVAQHLAALQQSVGRCQSQSPDAHPNPAPHRPPSESSFLLKLAAQSGVQTLKIAQQPTGEASVWIDGANPFHLSLTLASLLSVLALAHPGTNDELVGWKSLAEVTEHLQKQLGRPFTPHAIHQLVSRLRSALAVSGGVNPFLVQTHPKLGLRFALRKPSPPPTP